MIKHSTKINKTKILPLRWIANGLSIIAIRSLIKAFDLQESDNFGYCFKFHSKVFYYLNKPYEKWGTYYILNMDAWKDE